MTYLFLFSNFVAELRKMSARRKASESRRKRMENNYSVAGQIVNSLIEFFKRHENSFIDKIA
jgi:hypothetical protein